MSFLRLSFFLLVTLIGAGVCEGVWARPASELISPPTPLVAQESAAPALTPPTVLPEGLGPIQIAPHRAIYKMSLGSVKNGSGVSGVSGTMMFEWADACDGWAIQQHLRLHFSHAEGDETAINSTVISWEAKDGKRYNFNVRRLTDGKETENYRGKATLDEHGGLARYNVPKDKKDAALPPGSIFPSSHTAEIIRHAEAGDKLFTRRVFDGSDDEGAADVSAFVGGILDASTADLAPSLKDNPLLQAHAWPVRLAFYKPDTETGEPDYEMDLLLQSNGVSRSMQIDYGDFSVLGTLTDIESLPAANCAKASH